MTPDMQAIVVVSTGIALLAGVLIGVRIESVARRKASYPQPVLHIPQIRGVAEMSETEIQMLVDRIAESVDEMFEDEYAVGLPLGSPRPPVS